MRRDQTSIHQVALSMILLVSVIAGSLMLNSPAFARTAAIENQGGSSEAGPIQDDPPPNRPSLNSEGGSTELIKVLFVEGSGFRLLGDGLVSNTGVDDNDLQQVLETYEVQDIERLFSEPVDQLLSTTAELEASLDRDLPDLTLWYWMRVDEGTDINGLVEALNALPEVEMAFRAPLPAPPPGGFSSPNLVTPSMVADQDYLEAATDGIDAFYAHSLAGGTGSNVTIVDIEYAFNGAHEDLPPIPILPGGDLFLYWGDNHGTAVLGELVGMNNSYGVTGIAYGSGIAFSPQCITSTCTGTDYNVAEAVNRARLNTSPGDVILMETQTDVCAGSGYGPSEWGGDVYSAVLLATSSGRIVVSAAGNGGVDLDHPDCLGYFDREQWDSGAIIVGAGAPGEVGFPQTDRSRLSFSSYGSRVDLQGWGEWVTTTGYGDRYTGSGKNEWYTSTFNGTSSASPIVAGAAALLSSISQENGLILSPGQVREILRETGSPQQAHTGFPLTENIGPRPNLYAAINGSAKDNVGVYIPSRYRWYRKHDYSQGWSGVTSYGFGGDPELKPVAGDWDGDGIDTAGFYKPSQYKWYLKHDQIDGWAGTTSFFWGGAAEMIPISGDWDGDGVDTPGFYKPSIGTWYFKNDFLSGWSGVNLLVFGGAAGNIPVVGDWNGDGHDGVGFFVPSQNRWYLKDGTINGWGGVTTFTFGTADPMDPVTGDWDGDGVDTVGGYTPSKWNWYLKDDQVSGWSNVTIVRFGIVSAYKALAGDWQ